MSETLTCGCPANSHGHASWCARRSSSPADPTREEAPSASPGEAGEDERPRVPHDDQCMPEDGCDCGGARVDAYIDRLAARLSSQSEEIARLRRRVEIMDRALTRYVPCADHRDKLVAGECQVCRRERAESQLARLREERDQLEKMAGGLSADLTAFHRKVAAALDPEHHLCIRDDDFGGQYADPIEVITETRTALAAAESQLARLREDAARLDWLEARDWHASRAGYATIGPRAVVAITDTTVTRPSLRAAIDAARASVAVPSPGDPT